MKERAQRAQLKAIPSHFNQSSALRSSHEPGVSEGHLWRFLALALLL